MVYIVMANPTLYRYIICSYDHSYTMQSWSIQLCPSLFYVAMAYIVMAIPTPYSYGRPYTM